jgi:hypothetical protein
MSLRDRIRIPLTRGYVHNQAKFKKLLTIWIYRLSRLMLVAVNRKQWSKDDFAITSNQVWLNLDGRRKAICHVSFPC